MRIEDSAKFWFPKLLAYPDKRLREWIPNTVMIDYDEELLAPSLMGQHTEEYDRLYYAVETAIHYL